MEIRPAQKKDIRPLAELWAQAFPGERTVEQRIRQLEAGGVYGGIETAWIAGDAGHAEGAFRAYRLEQHMHGHPDDGAGGGRGGGACASEGSRRGALPRRTAPCT